MAGPAALDIFIYQGDTYELPIRLRSVGADGVLGAYIDLTGSTLMAQIRDYTLGTILASFTVTVADQTNPATLGAATLSLDNLTTEALNGDTFSRWDLQITYPDGKVKTLLAGQVQITGEITE